MSHSQHSPSAHLRSQRALDEQISFVLAHPGMSVWLKNALTTAPRPRPNRNLKRA